MKEVKYTELTRVKQKYAIKLKTTLKAVLLISRSRLMTSTCAKQKSTALNLEDSSDTTRHCLQSTRGSCKYNHRYQHLKTFNLKMNRKSEVAKVFPDIMAVRKPQTCLLVRLSLQTKSCSRLSEKKKNLKGLKFQQPTQEESNSRMTFYPVKN